MIGYPTKRVMPEQEALDVSVKIDSEEKAFTAVKKNPGLIREIPEEFCTAAVYEMVVSKEGGMLSLVPWSKITEHLCFIAVKKNAWSLSAVPDKFLSPDLCRAAFKQDGDAIALLHLRAQESSVAREIFFGLAAERMKRRYDC